MSDPIDLFVEGCSGLAAMSLRLADPNGKPPVTRMGNKAGYSNAILDILGLAPGSGAKRWLLCDPDPGIRTLLNAYRDPEIRSATAEVFRSWTEEEPFLLWRRLKDQGPLRPDPPDPMEVARYVWTQGQSFCGTGQGFAPARSKTTVSNYAKRIDSLPTLEGLRVSPDLRLVDPGEVFAELPSNARVVLYLDPPYVETSGYGHELSRAEVVRVALRWASYGATVVISEAEPLRRLVRLGWKVFDITRHREGVRRQNFSVQQREVLTVFRGGV